MDQKATREPSSDAYQAFCREVEQVHGWPLWLNEVAAKKPQTLPFLWKYRDYRPLLMKAADVVPMELAARRVLIMANPGIVHGRQASNTLLANLQIIQPGEIAPAHRHAACALRLMIEGQGAYTAVGGEKSYMAPGDFVTTPNWSWHDHGNDGDESVIWLDGLDIPLVQALETNFFEFYPEARYPLDKPDDMSLRLHGGGALKPTWVQESPRHTPLVNYRYAQTRSALTGIAQHSDGSPYDGVSLEYVNPLTGGPALATIACFATLLRPGLRTQAHRHSGGTIYHVIEGRGRSIIAGRAFEWEGKDTFVVPSWAWHEHQADGESVLFSYTDAAALRALGLYREEALEENGGHQKVEGPFAPIPAVGGGSARPAQR